MDEVEEVFDLLFVLDGVVGQADEFGLVGGNRRGRGEEVAEDLTTTVSASAIPVRFIHACAVECGEEDIPGGAKMVAVHQE